MGRLLFAVFLIVPLIEIALFITIGQAIGLWPTLLGVVVTALIGSAIVRLQGMSLIADIRRTTAAGALPAQQLAEGMMVGIAGALLLTPGYFTDLCGFLLLVPGIRAAIYNQLKSRITVMGTQSSYYGPGGGAGGYGPGGHYPGSGGGGGRARPHDPDVVDLDEEEWRDER